MINFAKMAVLIYWDSATWNMINALYKMLSHDSAIYYISYYQHLIHELNATTIYISFLNEKFFT